MNRSTLRQSGPPCPSTLSHASARCGTTRRGWRPLGSALLALLLLLAVPVAGAQEAPAPQPSVDAMRAQLATLARTLDRMPGATDGTATRDAAAAIQV
ncbi:MAG TPA: hypothetical protein VLK29_04380, partial [Luteimonas sp.]|nr:hypothetical protein [Luteimonas sp.]